MNSTNRALNRAVILVIGLAVAGLGVMFLAVNVLPGVRSAWMSTAPDALSSAEEYLRDHGTGALIGVVAVMVVVIVLLLVFVFRQGRGRTGSLISSPATDNGRTEVSARLAKDALEDYLSNRPEFVASHVSTYLVRRHPTLKVSATLRRGVSPGDAVTAVRRGVDALDLMLGAQLPTLLQLSGGFRAKVAESTRIQ